MIDYTNEYAFIRKDEEDKRLPTLKADKNTAERRYYYELPIMGSAPFIFFNGYKEEFKKAGIKDRVADVLFAGANFAVRDHVRDRLLALNVPGITMHPTVYIDDSDNWHEDFWFITFSDRFDCWDRQLSIYDPDPLVIGASEMYSVSKYVLNGKMLDQTPAEQRLLFQMGGTDDNWVVCHQSLAQVFRQNGQSGAALIPLSEY